MYFTRFHACRGAETCRESRILRGLNTSKCWNPPRITYNTRWCSEARRESRILQGFEHFEAVEHAANHVFHEVLKTWSHWNTPWIMYFTRFWAILSIETRREWRILQDFEHFEALKEGAFARNGPCCRCEWLSSQAWNHFRTALLTNQGAQGRTRRESQGPKERKGLPELLIPSLRGPWKSLRLASEEHCFNAFQGFCGGWGARGFPWLALAVPVSTTKTRNYQIILVSKSRKIHASWQFLPFFVLHGNV